MLFVLLHERVKISRKLLCELINVWVESRGGFMINSEFVSFKLLDVCVGLGLRVYGDKIDLEEVGVDSVCRKKFFEKKVTISMVYNYLLSECERLDVEDYCRLYILSDIYEFLLPNRNGTVFVSHQCNKGFLPRLFSTFCLGSGTEAYWGEAKRYPF